MRLPAFTLTAPSMPGATDTVSGSWATPQVGHGQCLAVRVSRRAAVRRRQSLRRRGSPRLDAALMSRSLVPIALVTSTAATDAHAEDRERKSVRGRTERERCADVAAEFHRRGHGPWSGSGRLSERIHGVKARRAARENARSVRDEPMNTALHEKTHRSACDASRA